jgi:hypothetical protein
LASLLLLRPVEEVHMYVPTIIIVVLLVLLVMWLV